MDVQQAAGRLRRAADGGALAELCARHGVRVLTLFGSARTDPSTAHDLDIAVLLDHTLATPGTTALVTDLMELTGTELIDVLVLNQAPPAARFAGLVEALPLFEAEPGAWAGAQMGAAIEFYETDWLRRLDLELLAR